MKSGVRRLVGVDFYTLANVCIRKKYNFELRAGFHARRFIHRICENHKNV